MKRFVNGVEHELPPTDATATPLHDRLILHTGGEAASALAVRQGETVLISYKGRQFTVEKAVRRSKGRVGPSGGQVTAPMPGVIVDVLVEPGQSVLRGDKLLVLEAMKTQQAFAAGIDGVVESVKVAKGEQVVEGQLLVALRPEVSE